MTGRRQKRPTRAKRATQARIDVEDGIDSIQSTKMSVDGESWDTEFGNELEIQDGDASDVELDAISVRSCRAMAARLNYIPPDRPDLGLW